LPSSPGQLLRVEQDGAFTSLVGGEGAPGGTDAARLAMQLVAGVTVHRRRLDYILDALYDGKAGVLEPTVRAVLRVGLYESLILCTPAHAAVNEAVAACRALRRPRAAGLVNALLRSAGRAAAKGALPEPALPAEGAAGGDAALVSALGVRHSMPDWVVSRWLARFGRAEAEQLLVASNRVAAHGVRAIGSDGASISAALAELSAEATAGGAVVTPSPLLPGEFLRVAGTMAPLRAALAAGRAAVQDEAAALVVSLLDPRPGDALADVCAAPGGKALFAAARGANVTAVDVHAKRLALLSTAAAAQGVSARVAAVVAADAHAFAAQPGRAGAFDAVLVDAPCTGLGVLAKRADLRWRRTEADVAERARLQASLLTAAAALVRPGGVLVYSTCSTEPEENERVVDAFLSGAAGAAFALEPARDALSASGARCVPDAALSADGRFLAPLPHRTGTDAAFGARLRRMR
jgi:16S rRNA (cytosine967-C5)-methyltransferase